MQPINHSEVNLLNFLHLIRIYYFKVTVDKLDIFTSFVKLLGTFSVCYVIFERILNIAGVVKALLLSQI